MPGIVLISSTCGMPEASRMKSVRERGSEPTARWTRTASSWTRRVVSGGRGAGQISSEAPGVYLAW